MIKQNLFFLLCFTILFSCKNDDDSFETNKFLTLNVQNNYLSPDVEVDILLSDSTGNILQMIELEDNQSYQIGIPETGKSFLSYVRRSQQDNRFIYISTYEVVDEMTINIAKIPNLNLNQEEIGLDFSGLAFDEMLSNTISIGGSNGNFRASPYFYPADVLVSMNVTGEAGRKVYFQEDVDETFSDIITMDDLTDVADSTTLGLPVSGSVFSEVFGKRTNIDDVYHKLSRSYSQNNEEIKHYLPLADFDDFLLETSISFDNTEYYTLEQFSSFDFSHQIPSVDFDIISTTIPELKLSPIESCDYFSVLYRDFDNNDYNILWDFNGVFDSDVDTNLPNLEPYLKSFHSNYSFQDLKYIYTTGYKIENPFEYTDFIEMRIEAFATLKTQSNRIERLEKVD